MLIKLFGLLLIAFFYTVYISKMILQKQKGIQTDQIAKNKSKDKTFYVELFMKIATYSVVVAEVISIIISNKPNQYIIYFVGMAIAFTGDVIFTISVITMKDSWRAGIAKKDQTKMVTDGIYSVSRNPAFLGFDLVYVGILIMYFNFVLLIFTLFAITMLHLQILEEEKYLPTVFGEDYIEYKKHTHRYLGRK